MRPPLPDLLQFLEPYPKDLVELYLKIREWLISHFPKQNELIYDAYSAAGFVLSPSESLKDAFCHLPIYPKYISLGFNRGTEISDPKGYLEGSGKHIRHVKITSWEGMDRDELLGMLKEAEALALRDVKPAALSLKGISVVKTVSEKKRRP